MNNTHWFIKLKKKRHQPYIPLQCFVYSLCKLIYQRINLLNLLVWVIIIDYVSITSDPNKKKHCEGLFTVIFTSSLFSWTSSLSQMCVNHENASLPYLDNGVIKTELCCYVRGSGCEGKFGSDTHDSVLNLLSHRPLNTAELFTLH